jgi:hypothetical protein
MALAFAFLLLPSHAVMQRPRYPVSIKESTNSFMISCSVSGYPCQLHVAIDCVHPLCLLSTIQRAAIFVLGRVASNHLKSLVLMYATELLFSPPPPTAVQR